LDEAAFYSDENSASPDIETDRALEPTLATLPVSIKIIISSLHKNPVFCSTSIGLPTARTITAR
jgi:hypothetical protein